MSAKVDIRGPVLKATKIDVQGSSVVTQVYVDKSQHSLVALCSKGLYIYIFSSGNKIKKNYSTPKEIPSILPSSRLTSCFTRVMYQKCTGIYHFQTNKLPL